MLKIYNECFVYLLKDKDGWIWAWKLREKSGICKVKRELSNSIHFENNYELICTRVYTIHNFKTESSQGLIAPTASTVQESFILSSLEINKYIRSLYHFPKTQHQINCTWTLIVQQTRLFWGRSCYSLLIFIIESAPIMEEEKKIMEKLKKTRWQQLNIRETYSDPITNRNSETT